MKLPALSCFFSICALVQAGAQPSTQPLYLFTFEEGSRANAGSAGGEAVDRATAGVPAPRIEPDEKGIWRAEFEPSQDGTRGPSLSLPDSEERLGMPDRGDRLTILALVKWNGPDKHPDVKQPIIWKPLDEKGPAWALSITESGALRFDWSHADGTASHRLSKQKIATGEWVQIAAFWKNDHNEGLQLYIDGVPADINVPFTGGGPLRSGHEPIVVGSSPAGFCPLNGALRELRIYDIALEPDEVSALAGNPN